MKVAIVLAVIAILNFVVIELYAPKTEIDVTDGCTGDDEVVDPSWGYFLLFSVFFMWGALYFGVEDIAKWKT